MSHGIDGLQKVCSDICFYSPTNNPDVRNSFIGRIHRQGAKHKVRVHHILAEGTVDIDIKRTLDQKHGNQRKILEAIKLRSKMSPDNRTVESRLLETVFCSRGYRV